MPAAARSYVSAGLALMGVGMVTAGQITPPLQKAETRMIEAAVSLVAAVGTGQACSGYNTEGCDIWARPIYTPVTADPSGSMGNIPANLFNSVLGIPRAFIDGLNELSYALEVTGNWWVYSPTNVLGFDPADPPKITAMADLMIPFKPLSHAIGDQMAWWARANLPMNASCTGTVGPACADVGPILSAMFLAPIWKLASGYQFPELYNPVSDAEGALGEEIAGETGELAPWSGEYVKLNTSDWFTSISNYLQADPSANAPKPLSLPEIGATLQRFVEALVIAFNPFVPKSYLLKGWPYTALSPLFLPFVPIFCKECDPNNPGGPALPSAASAAAELPPAVLVSAPASEPAAGVDVSGPPATTDRPVTGDHKRDDVAGGGPAEAGGSTGPDTAPVDTAPVDSKAVDTAPVDSKAVDTAPVDSTAVDTAPVDSTAVETNPVVDTTAVDTKDAVSATTASAAPVLGAPTSPPSARIHNPRRGRTISSLEVLPGSAITKDDRAGAIPRTRAGAAAE